MLAHNVYDKGNWQFVRVEDLKAQIEKSWKEISIDYLNALVDSMPRRMVKVL